MNFTVFEKKRKKRPNCLNLPYILSKNARCACKLVTMPHVGYRKCFKFVLHRKLQTSTFLSRNLYGRYLDLKIVTNNGIRFVLPWKLWCVYHKPFSVFDLVLAYMRNITWRTFHEITFFYYKHQIISVQKSFVCYILTLNVIALTEVVRRKLGWKKKSGKTLQEFKLSWRTFQEKSMFLIFIFQLHTATHFIFFKMSKSYCKNID
jgi:hypothetical protein